LTCVESVCFASIQSELNKICRLFSFLIIGAQTTLRDHDLVIKHFNDEKSVTKIAEFIVIFHEIAYTLIDCEIVCKETEFI